MGSELYYYHQDEQLSTALVTDNTGRVRNYYQYDAFGGMLAGEEGVSNRIRYTGQQYDEISEQYYLRARYYNPVVGRFLQEDVYEGDGLNLYAYCGNNPVRYYDPSGYASTSNSGYEEGLIGEEEPETSGDNSQWLAKKNGEVDWKSKPNFGHTFTTHGQGDKNTKSLMDRAKTPDENGNYTPQGQWLNNQEAAEYLNSYGEIEFSQPPIEIPIPDGLGQVIHPDGTITPAIKARIVINRKTGKIRSAIPIDK